MMMIIRKMVGAPWDGGPTGCGKSTTVPPCSKQAAQRGRRQAPKLATGGQRRKSTQGTLHDSHSWYRLGVGVERPAVLEERLGLHLP